MQIGAYAPNGLTAERGETMSKGEAKMETNRTVIPAEPGWSVVQWYYDSPNLYDHPVMAWEIDPKDGRLYPITLFHGSLPDECRKWGMDTFALRHPNGELSDYHGQTCSEGLLFSVILPCGSNKQRRNGSQSNRNFTTARLLRRRIATTT